jgi:hypothetical protein
MEFCRLNFNDVVSGRGILTQDLFGLLLQQSQVIGQGQRVYGERRQTHIYTAPDRRTVPSSPMVT